MNRHSQAAPRSAKTRCLNLPILLLCAFFLGKGITPLAELETGRLQSALQQDQFIFSALLPNSAAVQRNDDSDSKNDADDPLFCSGFHGQIFPCLALALRTGTPISEHSLSRAFQPQLPRAPPLA